MFLKKVIIENSGPLRRFELDLEFRLDGSPKPLILVGSNGGGKTNLLSLVTDAMFEAAASHYQDVLPRSGIGRSYFRVVGGRTTTLGTAGGFSLLKFEHQEEIFLYKEKAGDLDPALVAQRVPADLAGQLNWPQVGSFKEFTVPDQKSKEIFEGGVYAYFPASRSEIPFWLNRESIPETEFDLFGAFANRLRKPIFVERSLDLFKQWIIAVILESRSDVQIVPGPPPQLALAGDVLSAMLSSQTLNICNLVLQRILSDASAKFVWLGRNSPDKIAVALGSDLALPNLDALSGGQSILLGLFGTLLRYGDHSKTGSALSPASIEGICVVDEIDTHIHVDLQYTALPSLIAMFPRIQFILSSHSPLFVLGMEKTFGAEGLQVIEMPDGKTVTAQSYSEFGKAMEALSATEAFNEKLLLETSQTGIPVVFVEGETDTPYLLRAADVLGRTSLVERCEIQWIGAKDDNGQGFHTGKAALDHTLAVLRANPKLANRPVLLLYDNDANVIDATYGIVTVREMPSSQENTRVRAGIENLLTESAIQEDDYQVVETPKPNGDIHIRKTLRKTDLCDRICENGDPEEMKSLGMALDTIEKYLDSLLPATGDLA